MNEYTLIQLQEDKEDLRNRINKLMKDFYSKYEIRIRVSSDIEETVIKDDMGQTVSTSITISTDVNCYV